MDNGGISPPRFIVPPKLSRKFSLPKFGQVITQRQVTELRFSTGHPLQPPEAILRRLSTHTQTSKLGQILQNIQKNVKQKKKRWNVPAFDSPNLTFTSDESSREMSHLHSTPRPLIELPPSPIINTQEQHSLSSPVSSVQKNKKRSNGNMDSPVSSQSKSKRFSAGRSSMSSDQTNASIASKTKRFSNRSSGLSLVTNLPISSQRKSKRLTEDRSIDHRYVTDLSMRPLFLDSPYLSPLEPSERSVMTTVKKRRNMETNVSCVEKGRDEPITDFIEPANLASIHFEKDLEPELESEQSESEFEDSIVSGVVVDKTTAEEDEVGDETAAEEDEIAEVSEDDDAEISDNDVAEMSQSDVEDMPEDNAEEVSDDDAEEMHEDEVAEMSQGDAEDMSEDNAEEVSDDDAEEIELANLVSIHSEKDSEPESEQSESEFEDSIVAEVVVDKTPAEEDEVVVDKTAAEEDEVAEASENDDTETANSENSREMSHLHSTSRPLIKLPPSPIINAQEQHNQSSPVSSLQKNKKRSNQDGNMDSDNDVAEMTQGGAEDMPKDNAEEVSDDDAGEMHEKEVAEAPEAELNELMLSEVVENGTSVEDAVENSVKEVQPAIKKMNSNINQHDARRSQRTRLQPLAYWKNERPVYRRDSTGLAFRIVGVDKGSSAEENRPKRKVASRKPKTEIAREVIKRSAFDLSIHAPNVDRLVKNNEKRKKKVVKSGFKITEMAQLGWKPSGVSTGVMMAIKNKHPGFAEGVLKLDPFAHKVEQRTAGYTTSFTIAHGVVSVTFGDSKEVIMKTLMSFDLPPNTLYSIKNLRNDTAYVSFIVNKVA